MQQQTKGFDIYEKVTDTIIALLEQGTIPWRKPWREAGLPKNLLSGRYYTGINYLLLNALPYEEQLYLTWNQIKSVAGSVIKGEAGHLIVFRKTIEKDDAIDPRKKVKKQVWRYYFVYNISQCRNIPSHLFPANSDVHPIAINDPIQKCELLLEEMENCPVIKHADASAYYVPSLDYINMPALNRFESSATYYCTLFHELVHATGHSSRLNRKEVMGDAEFGSELYSKEELIAEIGACYLNSAVGIANETIVNSVAYMQSWLQQLRNDKFLIVTASNKAQRAVDYIMGVKRNAENFEALPAENMG